LKKILGSAIFILSCVACIASGSDTAHKKNKDKKLEIRAVPLISYAPETRFLFGVGALTPFKCSNDSITKHSLIAAFVAYSQNRQDYIYVPYQIYTKDNNYYFEGEADYYNYSYYYWGIGEARVPKELYNVRFPKILLSAYRKITTHFYAGLDYYYENDVMGATQPGGSLAADTIRGSKGSTTSGGGLDLLYDTRDHIFFPHYGWYIRVTSYFNFPTLGSTYSYDKVVTDAAWYHQLAEPVVLALNQHNQFTWGDVPFNQLALLGGTKQIRGYYMGYYRDDILSYLQAEARVHLIGRVSCVAFGTMAFYGNYNTFPETPTPVFAEGVGLRYNYEKKQHINVRFDVGYGVTVEYYLTIQEAF
jgi:outer membrane protein assembly factor BamA